MCVMKRRVILILAPFLLLCADRAPAQSQGGSAAVILSSLVNRAEQSVEQGKTFAEFSELLGAYLAAKNEMGAAPTMEDLLTAERAVGLAEQQAPSTSQQSGATANSVGTTTLVEKPGIADLLNLAIERGAITRTTSGTTFTLQTTPYMIYSGFGGRDTEETWKNLAVLRHIGISATFDQSEGSAEPKSNNFESGELKYTIGDRSPRDQESLKRIRDALESKLSAVDKANDSLGKFRNSLSEPAKEKFKAAQIEITQWMQRQPKPLPADEILKEVSALLKDFPVLTASDEEKLKKWMNDLDQEAQSLAAASEKMTEVVQNYLEERHSQFSLTYGYQRDKQVSDFSTIKLLWGYDTGQILSANLNGEVTLNNHGIDVAGAELERVRAYSVEAGLTIGKFANDALDFNAGAKWLRPQGEEKDIRSFQAKLNLYLPRGVTIPFSLSYANRTEGADPVKSSGKSRLRLNVGFSLTGDALMGVARRTQ